MNTCSSCAFFAPGEKQCRANPPAVFPFTRPNAITQQQEVAGVSIWPPVEPEMWCGQHRTIGSDPKSISSNALVEGLVEFCRRNGALPGAIR